MFLKKVEARYILAFDEEHDEYDETDEADKPSDDDIFLSPAGNLGSHTDLSAGGRYVGTFKTEEAAQKAIVDWMKKENWYPNIWYVSDHGNQHPYVLDDKYQKMLA